MNDSLQLYLRRLQHVYELNHGWKEHLETVDAESRHFSLARRLDDSIYVSGRYADKLKWKSLFQPKLRLPRVGIEAIP